LRPNRNCYCLTSHAPGSSVRARKSGALHTPHRSRHRPNHCLGRARYADGLRPCRSCRRSQPRLEDCRGAAREVAESPDVIVCLSGATFGVRLRLCAWETQPCSLSGRRASASRTKRRGSAGSAPWDRRSRPVAEALGPTAGRRPTTNHMRRRRDRCWATIRLTRAFTKALLGVEHVERRALAGLGFIANGLPAPAQKRRSGAPRLRPVPWLLATAPRSERR